MAREKILVVDDEEDLLELVQYNLAKVGFQVEGVSTGEDALRRAKANLPDLILLDLLLPAVDGLEVCKRLKSDPNTAHIPVVMLTARGEDSDVVSGLEIGADDYIIKPFRTSVLIARVRAVLRRRKAESKDDPSPIRIHQILIHPGRHEVLMNGNPLSLTFTEFRLLQFLAQRPGWTYSRQQIVDAVKGDDYPVTDRSVDVQIASLRKKLGRMSGYIETVRGVGYRFKE